MKQKTSQSSSTEHAQKQPAGGHILDVEKTKLGTPDSVDRENAVSEPMSSLSSNHTGKLHKVKCAECKAESDITLDEAQKIYEESKIKNCTDCGLELSAARALEGEERQKASGGTFRIPVKYDHFEIKSLMRDEKGDFICKEIDIMLLFNNPTLNFIIRYNQYQGGKCLCQGDGETARKLDVTKIDCNPETCTVFAQKKCKPNGILSVILTKSPRFNSIKSILSSLFLFSNLTGGVLAMIPLKLTVSPMQVQPVGSASPQTMYVVKIEFSGTAPELLHKTGVGISLHDKQNTNQGT